MLAITGLLLVASVVLFAHYRIEEYIQHLQSRAEDERREIECANTVCLGPIPYIEAEAHLRQSMYELLAGMTLGSVGLVLLGLNIRDLAKPPE